MSEHIGDVLIPAEKVSEVKQGKKSMVSRKFFPGYVLININLFSEDVGDTLNRGHLFKIRRGLLGFWVENGQRH